MNFFKQLFFNAPKGHSTYVAIFLKGQEGLIVFVSERGAGHTILGQKKFKYSNAWDNIVEDLDQAIFQLEKETKQAPQQAIFFVYTHLIDRKSGEIKEPYLGKIKEITRSLEITPLGYIEYHEAVVEYLNNKESLPLTALLIEFDGGNMDVFVYRAGKLVYEESVVRTSDLIEDIFPTFERIRERFVIPSRIILYDSSDLDDESSRLISHKWKEDFFVQMPRAQVIEAEELVEVLISTFLKQTKSGEIQKEESPFRNEYEEGSQEDKTHGHPAHNKEKEILGFSIGRDVSVTQKIEEKQDTKKASNWRAVFTGFYKKIIQSVPVGKYAPAKFFLPGLGVVLIMAAFFLSEYFFHTADITVFLPSRQIQKTIDIDNISLQVATSSASFSEKKSTTGSREVGDRARGAVTIYNSSLSSSKSFAKGTAITSDGIEFTLDDDITVASASGDASSVKSSTADVGVTASKIGPESNLDAGKTFSINGESSASVIAKNNSKLTGGTRNKIQTVSQKDLTDLEGKLEEKALKYAEEEIGSKLSKGMILLPELTKSTTSEVEYSAEVGEEAKELAVESTVDITYFAYRKQELLNRIKKLISDDIDDGLVVEEENVNYTVESIDRSGDNYDLQLDLTVKLTSKMEQNEIRRDMRFKTKGALEEVLRKKYKAEGVDFSVQHPFGLFKAWTPLFTRNITLKLSYP